MTLSQFNLSKPPKNICMLRLSALGDITHTLPVLRTLQKNWPATPITWIIGKTEYELVKGIEGVEFIIFDKSQGFAAYLALRQQMQSRHFDVLLHLQVSLRASAITSASRLRAGPKSSTAKPGRTLGVSVIAAPLPKRSATGAASVRLPAKTI